MKQQVKSAFNLLASNFGSHRRKTNTSKLWVMMYHRILPVELAAEYNEEPGMYVTPETFRNHMRWLLDIMTPIRLADWPALSQQHTPGKYFAITFDDGWQDNFEYAFPVLQELNIPATIFVVSDYMGTGNVFWPNRLAKMVSKLSDFSDTDPALEELRAKLRLSKETDFSDISSIIATAKQYSDTDINLWLDAIDKDDTKTPQLLSWDQLQQMSDSGIFDIGAHTRHHIRLLDNIDNNIIEDQILGSKKIIESKLPTTSNLFCYPNGDYCEFAEILVKDNFDTAVTTQSGINTRDQNLHELKRVGVHQDISASKQDFYARLACWR